MAGSVFFIFQQNDTARVIYAFHASDPLTDEVFLYHNRDRGSRSLTLLQPMNIKRDLPDEARVWDIQLPNVSGYLYHFLKMHLYLIERSSVAQRVFVSCHEIRRFYPRRAINVNDSCKQKNPLNLSAMYIGLEHVE